MTSSAPETPVHLPLQPRSLAIRTVALVLAGWALVDGAGYFYAGDAGSTSATFAVLRGVPGGMRSWGAALLVGAALMFWAIGRDGVGRGRALHWALIGGFAYFALWTYLIVYTWAQLHGIPAWGAVTKPAGLAVFYYLAARKTAPFRPGPHLVVRVCRLAWQSVWTHRSSRTRPADGRR